MKKLFTWTGLLFLGLTCLIAGARAVSAGHDGVAQRFLGTDDSFQRQACWYGICPGQVTIAQALTRFTDLTRHYAATLMYNPTLQAYTYTALYAACVAFQSPDWQSCVRVYGGTNSSQFVIYVNLTAAGLRLGDMIRLLGTPVTIQMCEGNVPYGMSGRDGISATFRYANGLVVSAYRFSNGQPTIYARPGSNWGLSPGMFVSSVSYYAITAYPYQADGALIFPWRSFGSRPDVKYRACGV